MKTKAQTNTFMDTTFYIIFILVVAVIATFGVWFLLKKLI